MTSAPIPLSATDEQVRTPLHRLLQALERLRAGDDPLTARQQALVRAAQDEGEALLRLLGDARPASGTEGPVTVAAPVAAAAPARPVRVLVADDSDVNLLIASAMLTAQGADVVTVADGRQAVSAVRDGEFDLVLLDIRMPVMSGVDAAQAIRQLPGWRGSSRLVALTASADEDERRAFLEAGMDAVLVKPVTTDDLRRTLAATAGGRSA